MTNVNNIQSNNIFKDFPEVKTWQSSVGVDKSAYPSYASLNDKNKNQKDSFKTEKSPLASVNVSDDKKSGHKGGILAATLGTSILTVGVAAFFLSKGLSSSSYNKINDLLETLNSKLEGSSVSQKSKTLIGKAEINLAKGMKHVLQGLKSCANFTAIKDSTFDWLLRGSQKDGAEELTGIRKYTSKFADKVTNKFQNISYHSVDSEYERALVQTSDFRGQITHVMDKINVSKGSLDLNQSITIKGKEKTLGEWLNDINGYNDQMKKAFDDGFGKNARLNRREYRNNALNGLAQKVRDALWHDNGGILNFSGNKDKFKSYITEHLSMPGKVKLKNEIFEARKAFTNNIEHNYKLVKSNLQDISSNLSLKDEDSRKILDGISKKMTEYRSFSGANEAEKREACIKELSVAFGQLKKTVGSSVEYSKDTKDLISNQVNFITENVLEKENNKGALQELVTIVKALSEQDVKDVNKNGVKLFDKEFAQKIKQDSQEITKTINKATDMESNELYDKCAEFSVGAAPHDVFGLAIPIAFATYSIGKADDKKERVSNTLTTGIPILGTIGSMFYGATKMFAGPKNLGMALGVGFVLKQIGDGLNKLYLKYDEDKSFTKMAVAAYKSSNLPMPIKMPDDKKQKN